MYLSFSNTYIDSWHCSRFAHHGIDIVLIFLTRAFDYHQSPTYCSRPFYSDHSRQKYTSQYTHYECICLYICIHCVYCLIPVVFSLSCRCIYFFFYLVSRVCIYFSRRTWKSISSKNIYSLSWHFSNCILGLSWAALDTFFWSLFWWYMDDRVVISATLFLLAGLWTWVYNTDDKNPLFFTGLIAVIGTFMVLWHFRYCRLFLDDYNLSFVFSGGLVLIARAYKNEVEELILAAGSVIFFCASDVVLIFQNYWLFELSTLFFFNHFLVWSVRDISSTIPC